LMAVRVGSSESGHRCASVSSAALAEASRFTDQGSSRLARRFPGIGNAAGHRREAGAQSESSAARALLAASREVLA
jgi:hypothetical protein